MKKFGLANALSGISGLSAIIGGSVGWTPAQATTDGGVLPHSWFYGNQSQKWQDSGKTTLAINDGDPIGAMTNQGSDAYDIIQAVTATKPAIKLNIKNGQPALLFDGGDLLAGAFNGGIKTQPNTILAVAQLTNIGNNKFIIDGDVAARRHAIFRRFADDDWSINSGANLLGGVISTNWLIHTAVFAGASSQFWHNGLSQAAGDADTQSLGGIYIGSTYASTGFWIGYISEILIYISNLSNADKNQLGQYLATKYSISYTDI